jgi:hypothetical protein
MREIQTVILRLFVHDDASTLRGVLRAAAEDEEYPFSDEQMLLSLLHRLSRARGGAFPHAESHTPLKKNGSPPQPILEKAE